MQGTDSYLGPVHVYRMTAEQAEKLDEVSRNKYVELIKRKQAIFGTRWYADNTREPIRDETLREGLVDLGAVTVRRDLPTTSGMPKYQLTQQFAALFDPDLGDQELIERIDAFRKRSLSPTALARIRARQEAGRTAAGEAVFVDLPSGERRRLSTGESSVIIKSVVEQFMPRFLASPAVLWISESSNKVVARDDALLAKLGLAIEADKHLPDLVMADLDQDRFVLVFAEVVATDGAITEARRNALMKIATKAGLGSRDVAFLTAYADRDSPAFRKTISSMSWGSFAWFASEPDRLLIMHDQSTGTTRLVDLMQQWQIGGDD